MPLKFGKKPARTDSVKLKFAEVFNTLKLPEPPAVFGHEEVLRGDKWGMYANDRWGDCVWAGAAHEHTLWALEGRYPPPLFTTQTVLSDYSAVTGFNSAKPSTDEGTDVQEAAAYRQKTGIIDAHGKRHTIAAYAALRAGDLDQLALATWLFGAVGVGVMCPTSMEKQFDRGKPWTVVPGDTTDGGHYIPCVGRNSKGNFVFISWGRVQAATPEWVKKYMDEGIAYLSLDIIDATTKISPESFNSDTLSQYLRSI